MPRRRIDRTRLLAAIVALACLGTLGTAATWSGAAVIDAVAVEGGRHVTATMAAAASGLIGAPAFRASALESRERVRALPAVRDARVAIALPGTARIELVERQAIGRWAAAGTEWFVDAEGVLFASADPTAAPELRVQDDRGARKPGDRLDPALVSVAVRLAAIPAGELRADMTRPSVRIDPGPAGIVLRSGGRLEIRFGGPERFDEKLTIVRAYLKNNPDRPLDYVDVARPDLIVVRPE